MERESEAFKWRAREDSSEARRCVGRRPRHSGFLALTPLSSYPSLSVARRTKKLWQGRFAAPPSRVAEEFTSSLRFDRRLWSYDLRGSEAHCQMLARQGIIPKKDADKILAGLGQIRKEFLADSFRFLPSDEDIHSAIERRLTEIAGPAGGRLHTARSRNDQVVLDMRMYLKEVIGNLRVALDEVREAIARLARKHIDLVMPGYTHQQRAQPVLLAHHLLAYYDMLGRDDERFADCRSRVDVMPLGSGALAGVPYPIDRAFVARQLGFHRLSENSIDAVSDRDFIAEFLAATAILFVHLSRLCADLTLWATTEFGFVEFPDEFSTGSSIMPQKKNPDVAELVRGKAGRTFGSLQAVLTVMKGLPLAYHSDLQEDKEPMFDAADTALATLRTLAAMLPGLRFDASRMRDAARGFLLATELADFLVGKGLPFRQAHGVVGALVQHCLKTGKALDELSLGDLRRFSTRFDRDVQGRLTPESAVALRRSAGGTARENVERRLQKILA
jgi:argininosuccinate lyase